MDKIMNMMERFLIPIAEKVNKQKHLMSIKDGFVLIMPVVLIGSLATLLKIFVSDIPNSLGYTNVAKTLEPLFIINQTIWWGSLAVMSLLFIVAYCYALATKYGEDGITASIIGLATLVITIPETKNILLDGISNPVSVWGVLDFAYIGATGLFSAIIIGTISTEIFVKLTKRNLVIKMPETVPPAVAKAFSALIPGSVALYGISILSYLINHFVGLPLNDLIYKVLQAPLLNMSQGIIPILIYTFVIQIFWFFGVHGTNMVAPISNMVYVPALLENTAAITENLEAPYNWVSSSWDAYVLMGGAGSTLTFILALILFSKKDDERLISRLSIGPGLFNINEPVIFGIPIVLNPIYFIPFIIAPLVMTAIAYYATLFGFVPEPYILVPWITPPILSAYLTTGGSVAAALLALFNFFVGTAIYAPFVVIASRINTNK